MFIELKSIKLKLFCLVLINCQFDTVTPSFHSGIWQESIPRPVIGQLLSLLGLWLVSCYLSYFLIGWSLPYLCTSLLILVKTIHAISASFVCLVLKFLIHQTSQLFIFTLELFANSCNHSTFHSKLSFVKISGIRWASSYWPSCLHPNCIRSFHFHHFFPWLLWFYQRIKSVIDCLWYLSHHHILPSGMEVKHQMCKLLLCQQQIKCFIGWLLSVCLLMIRLANLWTITNTLQILFLSSFFFKSK